MYNGSHCNINEFLVSLRNVFRFFVFTSASNRISTRLGTVVRNLSNYALWFVLALGFCLRLVFPTVLLPPEFPTEIFSASLPYMLRILALSYSLNWSFCDRRRLSPYNISNLFFRMKDSCSLGHHPGMYAPSYSIYVEITTKFGDHQPHTQSEDAPCHVIRDIFTYSGSNCNITITETRSFGNANG